MKESTIKNGAVIALISCVYCIMFYGSLSLIFVIHTLNLFAQSKPNEAWLIILLLVPFISSCTMGIGEARMLSKMLICKRMLVGRDSIGFQAIL
jgi:choline-glycine betaine transporter